MKHFLLAVCCLMTLPALAQDLDAQAREFLMEGKPTYALVARVEGDHEYLRKKWVKYVDKELHLKLRKNGNVYRADKVNIYRITDKRGDLLSVFYDDAGAAHMAVSFAIGYDIFLNYDQYPEEFRQFEALVNRFLWEYYRGYYEDYVALKNKQIKTAEKQVRSFSRQIKQQERSGRKEQRAYEKALKKNPDATAPATLAGTDERRLETERLAELRHQVEDEVMKYKDDLQRGKLRLIEARSRLN